MNFLFSILIFSFLMVANSFAANFTVNGEPYSGQKFKVYPNSESTFNVKFSAGNVGRAESSNQSFVVRSETEINNSSNSSTGTTISNMSELKVFVKANAGTRLNTTSKINLIPALSSGNTNYPFFEVVMSVIPSITNIELMNADIKNLQKGLPIRIIVKGSGLDDVTLNLPKNIRSKVVKFNDKEMTLELSSTSKSFKGVEIDQSNFAVKSAKVNLKFAAKKLDLSKIK